MYTKNCIFLNVFFKMYLKFSWNLQIVATSVNVLSNSFVNLHCSWLKPLAWELDQTTLALVEDIQRGRGYDITRVPKVIQELLNHQPKIVEQLLKLLREYERDSHYLHSYELSDLLYLFWDQNFDVDF